MKIALAVPLLLLLGAAPVHEGDPVDRFQCGTRTRVPLAGVSDVRAAYSSRAVAIIDAALGNETARLERWVSPAAKFIVIQGDVGAGPRSSGVPAAIEFVTKINPKTFEFSAGSPGPFALNPCGSQTAELTLRGKKPDEAILATFKYQDGLLSEVQASSVGWVTGEFHATP